MKKRPLAAIIVLSVITLGFYELYWLVATRNEMVRLGAKVPSAGLAILVRGLQLLGFFAVVVLVLYAIPTSQRNHDTATNAKPSKECFITYNQNSQCKKAVDKYYTKDETTSLLLEILGIIVVVGILDWFYVTGWVRPYAVAVEQITQGFISASMAIIAYGAISPLLGMLFIQRAFNQR